MKLAARARAGAVEVKREPTGAMAAAAKDGRDEKDDDDDAKRAMELHRSLNRASDRAAREFCKVAVEAGDVRQLQEAAERTQVLLLLDEDAGECEVEIEAFRKLLVVLESHLAEALAARGVTDAQVEAARRMGATREVVRGMTQV